MKHSELTKELWGMLADVEVDAVRHYRQVGSRQEVEESKKAVIEFVQETLRINRVKAFLLGFLAGSLALAAWLVMAYLLFGF